MEANAEFDRVADLFGAAVGERDDLEDAKRAAIAAAKSANVEAVHAGKKKRADVAAIERDYAEKLTANAAEIETLTVAVDEVGNELARAIGAHRREWLSTLDGIESEAMDELAAALKAVRDALAKLGPARGAPAWLRGFNVDLAIGGRQQQWAGGRIDVDTMGVTRESFVSAEEVLRALDEIVRPTKVRRRSVWGL